VNDLHKIQKSLQKLESYIDSEQYIGFDPYDGLMSPLFRVPVLSINKNVRFLWQQLFRRMPVNIRNLFCIKKGYNPVTLGLCIQAYSYLINLFPDKLNDYQDKIEFCLDELIRLKSENYSGSCWGYDFDWESRYITIPAFTPTAVATGFITNALYELYQLTGNEKAKEICIDAVQFVINDLNKTWDGQSFCYSYSPVDHQIVFNATMKGARLLSQVYTITGNNELVEEARSTIDFVIKFQREDGSWIYSEGDARIWVDNFHTAYVLDCLDTYINLTDDKYYITALNKGLNFYFNNLFIDGCIPKYNNKSLYPIDTTSAAQSIISACRFNQYDLAVKIAIWMINNMQDTRGFFYYQKHKLYTNKISYMRWSNAWMFVALSSLLLKGTQ